MDWVDEVVVVDNASDDSTGELAQEAGAKSVHEVRVGMGHAVRAGLLAASHDWVMKVDADLEKFEMERFEAMVRARGPGVGLIKGDWQDPKDNMPMTRLLVKPALAGLCRGLSHLRSPNTGIYLVNRSIIAHQEIVGTYAADLDVMLRVHAAGAKVIEVDIGRIRHDVRDVSHYNAMAETIMGYFLDTQLQDITREIVILAERSADVIAHALGLCAARARAGARVSLYLGDWDTKDTQTLNGALAGLPTVAVHPLSEAEAWQARGAERRVLLISALPSDRQAHGTARALAHSLHARVLQSPDQDVHWLEMQAMGAAQDFLADHGFDIQAGQAIKSTALDKAGLADQLLPREVFQTAGVA